MINEVSMLAYESLYNVFWFDFNENLWSYNFYFVKATYLSFLHST